jgi:hypothetical protein
VAGVKIPRIQRKHANHPTSPASHVKQDGRCLSTALPPKGAHMCDQACLPYTEFMPVLGRGQ